MSATTASHVQLRTEAPRIPDHEILRCIGKGSYGEVWLGRSVTGSLRAVKVVRREDFELDRTFEREFEGIRQFEPIARDHPGLVHILHVGRNDEEGFYYYVMELGDDREKGTRVEPGDYEPRTMGTDRLSRHRLPAEECVQHGIALAEALAHMHEHGLTHRDIKPSNIIFVNGKPKLADIGLVAQAGQNTFVGTEGFVPPEGPGSTAADIYSLGMVLYEMSTGCDRLQFPELPADMGPETQRPIWRALNDVVCKACSPVVKKRHSSARQMAVELCGAWKAKTRHHRWLGRLLWLPVKAALIAFVLLTWRHGGAMPWPPGRFTSASTPFLTLTGSVSFTTTPDGVDVFYRDRKVGVTPCTVDQIDAGEAVFRLEKNRYRPAELTVDGIAPGRISTAPATVLKFYHPPRPGLEWENSLGMKFDAGPAEHISRDPISEDDFRKIISDAMSGAVYQEDDEYGNPRFLVRVSMSEARRFCEELTKRELNDGWLPENLCYGPLEYAVPVQDNAENSEQDDKERMPTANLICFRIRAERRGEVSIESDPNGAAIFPGENPPPTVQSVGAAPVPIKNHMTGPVVFTLRLPGYEDSVLKGDVPPGATLPLKAVLTKSRLPLAGEPWENSLGMKFTPFGYHYAAIWETRVQDYAEFSKATGHPLRRLDANRDGKPDVADDALHPVVHVTRAEAGAFCDWLTARERAGRWIPLNMAYRLPTDAEWSEFADQPGDELIGPTPRSRHNRWLNVYPWIRKYPPPDSAGNYGDLTALEQKSIPGLKGEAEREVRRYNYRDPFAFTAPAGSFAPYTRAGFFDLSGNVWELILDDYGGTGGDAKYAVARGGSWAEPVSNNRERFYTHYRYRLKPDEEAGADIGFRVVLARAPQ